MDSTIASWEQQLAAIWDSFDDEAEAPFLAAIDAHLAELPTDSAIVAFEVAASRDSTGHPDLAVPFYRYALDVGLEGERRRRAVIQLASSLRNLGAVDEAVSLLEAESNESSDYLADELTAFLALCLTDVGREREAAGLALSTLAPYLSRYQNSLRTYAREFVGATAEDESDAGSESIIAEATDPESTNAEAANAEATEAGPADAVQADAGLGGAEQDHAEPGDAEQIDAELADEAPVDAEPVDAEPVYPAPDADDYSLEHDGDTSGPSDALDYESADDSPADANADANFADDSSTNEPAKDDSAHDEPANNDSANDDSASNDSPDANSHESEWSESGSSETSDRSDDDGSDRAEEWTEPASGADSVRINRD